MRLDPRKQLDEEINNLPPIFQPPLTPRPLRPIPMRPLPKIPLRPDLGDKDPDMPPQFPPEVDTDGDGVVSQEEFLAYVRQVLRDAGFSEAQIRILIKMIREGRDITVGEMFRFRLRDKKTLRKLLKRIQREFPGGTPFVLPDDF